MPHVLTPRCAVFGPAYALGACLVLLAAQHRPARAADDADWQKTTVVYKTVGPTKIQADIYCRATSAARPCLVWIHGGALILGSRDGVPDDLVEMCQANDYVLVSLDYRLAPVVKLPAIIDDIKDAFRWIAREGAARFGIDPKYLVVAGGSAGGYLTMMTGFCVELRPKALVAYWGYGDVDGAWYTQPSQHYRKQPLVDEAEARRAVGGAVLTDGGQRERGKYYLYLRQNGLWTKEVTGFDPTAERAKLDPYCPVRNITADYPPILMIHGTADTDVPYAKSVEMAAALAAQAVPHELITVEGGGHGIGNVAPAVRDDAFRRAREFIRAHLRR